MAQRAGWPWDEQRPVSLAQQLLRHEQRCRIDTMLMVAKPANDARHIVPRLEHLRSTHGRTSREVSGRTEHVLKHGLG